MYKAKIFKDFRGHIQRENVHKVLDFSKLSKLKEWLKNNCDLRHNVLNKEECLNLELECLKKSNLSEFGMCNAIVVVTSAPKSSLIHQFQVKEWYIVNGVKQFVWSFVNIKGQDHARCNDGELHKIKTLKELKK